MAKVGSTSVSYQVSTTPSRLGICLGSKTIDFRIQALLCSCVLTPETMNRFVLYRTIVKVLVLYCMYKYIQGVGFILNNSTCTVLVLYVTCSHERASKIRESRPLVSVWTTCIGQCCPNESNHLSHSVPSYSGSHVVWLMQV